MQRWIQVLLCFLTLGAGGLYSEEEPHPVQMELIQEDQTIQPGHPFWVAIHLQIDDHWHSYWKNPGDAGMASSVEWHLPNGYKASPLYWPTPKRFALDSITGFGYEKDVVMLVQITPPDQLTESVANLSANVSWLVCSDNACVPGESESSLTLPVSPEHSKLNAQNSDFFNKARALLPKEQEGASASVNGDKIELKLPINGAQANNAQFFPEHQNVVDTHAEVAIALSDDSPDHYNVTLKGATALDKSIAWLKGILVLNNGQSIEIKAPFADKNLLPAPSLEGFITAMVLAFIGGMILNLMPCVLPVVSFKILGFVKLAGQSRGLIFKHGLAFAFGVLISFWALAGALLILKAYGHSAGWGFQLQEPIFVAILASILFVLSLSLFGVFEAGTSITSWAGEQSQKSKEGMTSSFLSGILATAVATPCTGPFLGSAVGFAMAASSVQALLIFTSLGVGMALPYVLLSAFPSLLRFVPKPGPWMITFKELMGFLMLATVLWLIWVFGAQTGTMATFFLLASFFLFAVGAWVYGKYATPVKSRISRWIGGTIAMICLIGGGYVVFASTSPWVEAMSSHESPQQSENWENFSPERVAELQSQGIPVLVDFTAKWCLICQVNHLVLTSQDVENKVAELGVVRMKADWTKSDPVITAELQKNGRNGVPLYLLYPGNSGASPHILPQVLTPDNVIEHLNLLET